MAIFWDNVDQLVPQTIRHVNFKHLNSIKTWKKMWARLRYSAHHSWDVVRDPRGSRCALSWLLDTLLGGFTRQPSDSSNPALSRQWWTERLLLLSCVGCRRYFQVAARSCDVVTLCLPHARRVVCILMLWETEVPWAAAHRRREVSDCLPVF